MKTDIKEICVSSDYTMKIKKEIFNPFSALELICKDKYCRYVSAFRQEDNSIELSSIEIVCPYCNHVYSPKTKEEISDYHINVLEKWTDVQLSFYEKEKVTNEISFFTFNKKKHFCPQCGNSSGCESNDMKFFIEENKHKIFVRCEVKSVKNIIKKSYLPQTEFFVEFPFFEQIEFNLRNGHTCIRVLSEGEKLIYSVDITKTPIMLYDCELSKWFNKSLTLKEELIKIFEVVSKSKVPFDTNEITLKDFIFMTMFVGYDKTFYNSIPYDKETLAIDKSFVNKKKLHNQKSVIKYLEEFDFIKYKSVRRSIYKNLGLLFYLHECELLFGIVKDINVFKNILENEIAFNIFASIHEHPVMMDFFYDYCKIKGAASLYGKICCYNYPWNDFCYYIIYYCSLSDHAKITEQENWRKRFKYDNLYNTKLVRYNLPIAIEAESRMNCTIDGFCFKVLRNTAECSNVGKELNNCLANMDFISCIIVSVSLDGRVLAAIRIYDAKIIEARVYNNGDIDEVDGLCEAISKWAERNEIKFEIKDLYE